MDRVGSYLGEWTDGISEAWNRFWFTPGSARTIGWTRAAVGACFVLYLLGYTLDLGQWYGSSGVLSLDTLRQITGADNNVVYRFSYFYLADQDWLLWALHGAGLCVAIAAAVGWVTRWSLPLSVLVMLSYVHRGPMLSGVVEPILVMALIYLSVAYIRLRPHERCFSLDQRFASTEGVRPREVQGIYVNVGLRLLQLHLAFFYAVSGLTKLSGDTWWIGEAVWTLMASTETRLLDFSGWGRSSILINLWSYAIVGFELLFPLLIWFRLWRPLLLALSVPHWLGIILLTGYPEFGLVMLAGGLAFLSPRPRPADREEVSPSELAGTMETAGSSNRKSRRAATSVSGAGR